MTDPILVGSPEQQISHSSSGTGKDQDATLLILELASTLFLLDIERVCPAKYAKPLYSSNYVVKK